MGIEGIPDFKAALDGITDKLRKRVLRNALAAGARIVRDAAKLKAPELKVRDGKPLPKYRTPGTVKNAISVRTSKISRREGNVGVFVNVRPLKSGRGAKNPKDPFYWRWLEFGWNPAGNSTGGKFSTAGRRARRLKVKAGGATAKEGYKFLQHGAAQLSAAKDRVVDSLTKALAKLNKPK